MRHPHCLNLPGQEHAQSGPLVDGHNKTTGLSGHGGDRFVLQPFFKPHSPQRTMMTTSWRYGARTLRDRLVIELLWSTGMRVSELARLTRDDVNLEERFAVVKQSKSGKPRLVPLSDAACRLIRRFTSPSDSVLGMTPHAIQLMLRRIGAPSAHAWRRGWTVNSLRSGVSQTSVQAAGGWASGAMVTRYTAAVSGELAISEFRRRQDPATSGHPAT